MNYNRPEMKIYDAEFGAYIMETSPSTMSGSFAETWDTGDEELDF